MADKIVDARGLSCPEPVLLAKQAIDGLASGTIDIVVDTATSCENVTRFAQSRACSVEVTKRDDDCCVVHVKKG